ncbi:hypothetical protein [Erwinia amylovora]|uniref:hypothetical protein n=1 Tax=Erwinia amylovora TaxID=552 RepID=UPI001443BE7E|nr:hypothetical protein [Erwinia amylovora]
MIKLISIIAGALMIVIGLIMGAIKLNEVPEKAQACDNPDICGLTSHYAFTAPPAIGWFLLAVFGVAVLIFSFKLTTKKTEK